jgi:hypothetical protein
MGNSKSGGKDMNAERAGSAATAGRLSLSRPTRTFIRHYFEMVVVMLLGMAVYGVLLAWAGVEVAQQSAEVRLLGMGSAMTVPMLGWMRYRGHGWTPTWEMAGAMIAPTVAAIALLRVGLVEDLGALFAIEHTAMFVAMLAVMLARREEYAAPAP